MTQQNTGALYISDLDGTLLTSLATVSDYTRAALTSLLNDGVQFTVASARSVRSMQGILGDIPLRLPVVEFNGAYVSDYSTGHHMMCNAIQHDVLQDVYHRIRGAGCSPLVSGLQDDQDRLFYSDVINQGMEWYVQDRMKARDDRMRHTSNLQSTLHNQIVCLTIIHDDQNMLHDLEENINQDYKDSVETHLYENQYSPGWYWLTVHDYRATKDQGIRELQQLTGLQGAELVVFGDHLNDIKMFGIADRSLAVQNAVGELKQCATHVIGTNDQDSVAWYIQGDVSGA